MAGLEKEETYPPCFACLAHDGLENEFTDMKGRNYTEHAEIRTTLRWVIIIGSSIVALVAFTYFRAGTTNEEVAKIGASIEYVVDTLHQHDKKIDNCRDDIYKERKKGQ